MRFQALSPASAREFLHLFTLVIQRTASAVPSDAGGWSTDPIRALTPEGIEEANAAAEMRRQKGLEPRLLLAAMTERAVATVAAGASRKQVAVIKELSISTPLDASPARGESPMDVWSRRAMRAVAQHIDDSNIECGAVVLVCMDSLEARSFIEMLQGNAVDRVRDWMRTHKFGSADAILVRGGVFEALIVSDRVRAVV